MTLSPYQSPCWYEDFQVDAVIEHAQRRIVTEADNLFFSRLSGHEHPSFFPYAGGQSQSPAVVLPFLVLAICGGIAVRATSQGAIANLGWEYVRFPSLAHVGDEFRAVTQIAGKRLSRSDLTRGIVTIITFGINQDAAVVVEAKRSFLVNTAASKNKESVG